ncbi:hypothetical protein HC931_20485 [Candidatus Gracilibacteria bacterium]|nr:hypothetical protein [Candidatus Gracilibacteria bacterium]NJM88060.1 hypothetical protein [Hydrococcus sp. RU_2_2]NJP19500.1 hypothetical protein [Hydrococcus sp. CRU_1_1]NJQ97254.1 hypothetical protein [Hydrococcus sp. CSU_1_8]
MKLSKMALILPFNPIHKQTKPSFWSKIKQFWELMFDASIALPELQVWSKRDRWGNTLWSACDPLTGRSISHITEEQMRIWIEQQYR